MNPTRRTQPYRKKLTRPKGRTLAAMLRGSPARRPNPQDVARRTQKMGRRRR